MPSSPWEEDRPRVCNSGLCPVAPFLHKAPPCPSPPGVSIKQSIGQNRRLQQPLPGDAGEIGHDILELLVRDLTEGRVVREGNDWASVLSPPTWGGKGQIIQQSLPQSDGDYSGMLGVLNNPHQKSSSLWQMETITEHPSWTQCREQWIAGSLTPNGYIYITFPRATDI